VFHVEQAIDIVRTQNGAPGAERTAARGTVGAARRTKGRLTLGLSRI
jgi:hypothetical protein